jgi:hypothetical protein
MTEKEFDVWGNLGPAWWDENGRLTRCSERQRKFAAALYQKCTQAKAAQLAGYPGDLEQLRVQGSRAAASDRVRDLLALAEAQDGGASSEDLITSGEIDRRLSRMIRAPDPGTSLKATELWHKLEDRKRERGETPTDDGFSDFRMERDFVSLGPAGACAYLFMDAIRRGDLGHPGNLYLLHDTYHVLMQHPLGPSIWQHFYSALHDGWRRDIDKWLADPGHQLNNRRKLWAEIGKQPPAPVDPLAGDAIDRPEAPDAA